MLGHIYAALFEPGAQVGVLLSQLGQFLLQAAARRGRGGSVRAGAAGGRVLGVQGGFEPRPRRLGEGGFHGLSD